MRTRDLVLVTAWIGAVAVRTAAQNAPLAPTPRQDHFEERLRLANDSNVAADYKTAESILLALIGDVEKSEQERRQLPVLWNQLALSYLGMGRYLDAEKYFERALAASRNDSPENSIVFRVLNGLFLLYFDTSQFEKADRIAARIAGMLPLVRDLGPEDLARYRANLGALYVARRKHSEAEKLLAPAIEEAERHLGTDHPAVMGLLQQCGANALVQGRWREAIPYFERTLKAAQVFPGPDHPGTARQLNNLAIAYRHAGRVEEAEDLSRQAAAIFEARLGPDHPSVADALRERAAALRSMRRGREAKDLEHRARLILAKRDQDNLLGRTVAAGELALRNGRN
jgi:tetratricopeptide (TPR) repeat protein